MTKDGMLPLLLNSSLIVLILGLFTSQIVFATEGQCVAASEIVANSGPVSGSWSDQGVVRDNIFDCSGDSCSYTGDIAGWPCADPQFTYAGPDTGYEYTYSFTSPGDGTCTFIEYQEGIRDGTALLGVVDWFVLVFEDDSACGPGSCIEYVWENVNQAICGSGIRAVCSHTTFHVTEGEKFFIVADIFAGLDAENPVVHPFNETWNVELKCDLGGPEIFIDGFETVADQ